jgi:hypothetical protein
VPLVIVANQYVDLTRDYYQAGLKKLLDTIVGRSRPPLPSPAVPSSSLVILMSWEQFLSKLRTAPPDRVEGRCGLLQHVRDAFKKCEEFRSMEPGVRKAIAGLPSDSDQRWFLLGSMKGAGYFHQAVNENSTQISLALDKIPLEGIVSRLAYEAFIGELIKAFPQKGCGIGTATRLLAMKRPDQFVCLNFQNRQELCKDFGIAQTGMDFERYWDDVVEQVISSPWWKAPRSTNADDAVIWDGRAALLDAIFYRP